MTAAIVTAVLAWTVLTAVTTWRLTTGWHRRLRRREDQALAFSAHKPPAAPPPTRPGHTPHGGEGTPPGPVAAPPALPDPPPGTPGGGTAPSPPPGPLREPSYDIRVAGYPCGCTRTWNVQTKALISRSCCGLHADFQQWESEFAQ